MLKKLKGLFQDHETTKLLQNANLDSTQTPINFQLLKESAKCLENERLKKAYINDLFKGYQSSKWTKRMKYMMAVHYLITLTEDESLIDTFLDTCSQQKHEEVKNVEKVTDVKAWIDGSVLTHYQSYIQKLCMHLEFYSVCRQNTECEFTTRADLIVAGFKALNLVNFVLETRVNFNKLGRYYQEFKVILDLFKMYLRDINIIYNFLKLTLD
jgi:radical SAM superfamily enzyme with C-terminal helix-hairpin-helix motif